MGEEVPGITGYLLMSCFSPSSPAWRLRAAAAGAAGGHPRARGRRLREHGREEDLNSLHGKSFFWK